MPTPSAIDVETLARTIYGEARGEPLSGQIAVAWAIVNRAAARAWWGRGVPPYPDHSLAAVCLKPYQFSCWLKSDPNLAKIQAVNLGDPAYRRAMMVACAVINGEADFGDPTGCTHYYRYGTGIPDWARGRTPSASVGHHIFFKDIA